MLSLVKNFKEMTLITCIANNKGGVGKTTTSINLATALTLLKKKVLLIDLDSQGNCAYGLGIEPYDEYQIGNTIGDILANPSIPISSAIVKTKYCDLIPNNLYTLTKIKPTITHKALQGIMLKNADLLMKYDHILIDTPPSIDSMTLNAAFVADIFLLVTEYSKYSMMGIKILLSVLESFDATKEVARKIHSIPKPILFTMYNSRIRLSAVIERGIEATGTGVILDEKIPRTIKVQENLFEGIPSVMKSNNPAGTAYKKLADRWESIRKKNEIVGKTEKYTL